VLYLYGELKQARRMAAAIVKARQQQRIETTQDLMNIIGRFVPKEHEKKELAKVFQALRIEVNHEMQALKEMLASAQQLLCEGGRLSVITYHSLEDRMVKNMMRAGNVEGKVEQDFFGRGKAPLRVVNSKVIVPTDEEVERNPRSRSAKLRIAEKI
jgi:16S rRNA (cytosine1402-N4)-methyltransferase